MIYFVTGASGAGKTACLETLRKLCPEVMFYDFDEVGVPEGADKKWRQRTTEHWLRTAIENEASMRDTCISGGAIFGEILACPSAPKVSGIELCLLDCYDTVRIERLKNRGTHGATQDMLCWAAWQRMHLVDPQWRQDVIRDDSAEEILWGRWENWQQGDPRWRQSRIDTTDLTIDQVANAVSSWMESFKA